MKEINLVPGFEKVDRKMLRSWAKPRVLKKRGPHINETFEESVISRLMYTVVEKVNEKDSVITVIANVAYGYHSVWLLPCKPSRSKPSRATNTCRNSSSLTSGSKAFCCATYFTADTSPQLTSPGPVLIACKPLWQKHMPSSNLAFRLTLDPFCPDEH